MKKIKNFKNFVNEELSPDTYKSAASKLKEKGHEKRARELEDYAQSFKKTLEPVTITLDGLDYELTNDNIDIHNDTRSHVNFSIVGDKKLLSPEEAWADRNIMNKYLSERGYIPGHIMDYDDLDKEVKDDFNDYINEIQPFIINFDFELKPPKYKDIHTKPDYRWILEMDGTSIKDRRTAVKILRFLKNFGKKHGGNIEKAVNYITVNDLYRN